MPCAQQDKGRETNKRQRVAQPRKGQCGQASTQTKLDEDPGGGPKHRDKNGLKNGNGLLR